MSSQYQHQGEEYAEAAPSAPVDFRNIYWALIERAWLILLCLGAAGFLTWGYLKKAPRIFASTAILHVDQEKKNLFQGPDVGGSGEDLKTAEALKTIERMLTSRSLLERVVVTNNLAANTAFLGDYTNGVLSREQVISRFAGMVRVNVQTGTRLINVTVEHQVGSLCQLLANSLVAEYVSSRTETSGSALDFNVQQLLENSKQWKEKMDEAEKVVLEFRKTNSVSVEERQDIDTPRLQELSRSLTEAENERIKFESDYAFVQQNRTNIDALLAIRNIILDPSVAELQARIAQQRVEIALVEKDYLPKHPKYIKVHSTLNEFLLARATAVQKAGETLANAFDAAKAREAKLRSALEAQQAEAKHLNEAQVEFKRLTAKVQHAKEQLDATTKLLNDISTQKNFETTPVKVIQKAFKPEKPLKPNKTRVWMMGIAAGMLVGVGLALLLEALDTSFRSPDQAEAHLQLSLLTTIPRVKSLRPGRKQLVMNREKEGIASEAFRTLRTNIAMLGPESERRTLMFTSALPDEGKSFCALNFAASLAHQGLRTLLIDADLRCPSIERGLGIEPHAAPGLGEFLTQHTDLKSLLLETEVPNLSLLPTGVRVPNPSELLSQKMFGNLLDEALLQFDRIVVDSAPLHPVSDSLLLCKRVTVVCLVVRAHKTPRKPVERSVGMLQRAGAPLGGLVFNGVERTRGENYYDYSYYPEYIRGSSSSSSVAKA